MAKKSQRLYTFSIRGYTTRLRHVRGARTDTRMNVYHHPSKCMIAWTGPLLRKLMSFPFQTLREKQVGYYSFLKCKNKFDLVTVMFTLSYQGWGSGSHTGNKWRCPWGWCCSSAGLQGWWFWWRSFWFCEYTAHTYNITAVLSEFIIKPHAYVWNYMSMLAPPPPWYNYTSDWLHSIVHVPHTPPIVSRTIPLPSLAL